MSCHSLHCNCAEHDVVSDGNEETSGIERARMLEERRAAKRASATPLDELEESAVSDDAKTSAETMLVAVEAVLTETRETVGALRVSALQQAHAASHRAHVTAESFLQAHKNMTDHQGASSQGTA